MSGPPKNRPSRSWVVTDTRPPSEIVTIESIESVFITGGIRYSFKTVPKLVDKPGRKPAQDD